jgi:hypothetical protein
MPDVTSSKIELIDRLWLPKIREAKSIIYPRKKKGRMRLFTLTDGISFREISKFEEENLIQKEDVVAWVKTMIKRSRAEAESVGTVFDGHIYDNELFLGTSCQAKVLFPFDIINLDFESQEPTLERGRIEIEMDKIEKIITLQNQHNCNKFVLMYTTLIDTCDIDANRVKQTSDSLSMSGWNGIELNGFTGLITDSALKQRYLQNYFEQLTRKYTYNCIPAILCLPCNIHSCDAQLFSIAGIFVR